MARTLIITWPDNEAAERFATILHQLQTKTYEGLTDEGLSELGDLLTDGDELPEMDAMVARPTKGCRCTSAERRRGRQKELGDWTRTPRFGWFVHAGCRRPSAYVVRHFVANMLGGYKDILPEVIGHGTAVKAVLDDSVIDLIQRKETIGA
jgi:hypothetical protein